MLRFFSAGGVPDSLIEPVMTLFSWGIVFSYFILLAKPGKIHVPDSFKVPVTLILISIFISMVSAYLYRDQSFFYSLRGYKNFYVFFLYFILFRLDFTYREILKLSIVLFFITLFVYCVDIFTFPDSYFASHTFSRRGAFTIRFYGKGFTVLGIFYFLNAYFREKKFYYFLLYVIGFVFLTFYSASRLMLLSIILGTLMILYYNRKEVEKYFFYIVPTIMIFVMIGVYYLETYILNLYSLTISQLNAYDTDVRYRAIKFFTRDFQINSFTRILGNGYPAIGKYSAYIEQINLNHGFYTEDLGLIGFWTHFGILGVVAWIMIFKKIFLGKTNVNNIFIKAYFIILFITVVSGYTIFSPGYMITTVFCLFLFDKNKEQIVEKGI